MSGIDSETAPTVSLPLDEVVRLGAVDAEFFAHYFFPKTFRQKSPPMHRKMWGALDNPAYRMVNLQCFRGSAKTTILRTFLARRIAYRVSKTALFIGGSEPMASLSIQWLRAQIERNSRFTSTFGLEPGKKWHETSLEIVSTIDGTSTWILGVGITSNIRGINFDDYRPDLIVADDVLTDENVLTEESRDKTTKLLLGAVAKSLAPRSEEPNAKLVMLQTPLHREDASMQAARAPDWHTERFSCWTEDTEDLPLEEQVSSWEVRFPTEELRKEKQNAIATGNLPLFLRESEVKIVSSDTSAFKPALLQFYTRLEKRGTTVLSIDPVPPPSERQLAKNMQGKDFEALVVQTRAGGEYYLREYVLSRGHTPSWTIAKAFELALRYHVSYISIDATAYQLTLKWLLEVEMQRRGQYFVVVPDKKAGNRSKYQKIVDTLQPLLGLRKYHCLAAHTEFVEQLTEYPSVAHDDLLDAVAIGLRTLINPAVELSESEYSSMEDEADYEPLQMRRKCP